MTPSDHETPQSAAADWLVRRQAGLTAAQAAAFAAWLSRSEDHQRAWAQAEAAWDAVDAEDDPLLDAMRADALSARPESRRAIPPWAMAAAAALVVAVLGVASWRVLPRAPVSYSAQAAPKVLTLADGSAVVLDPNTRLDVAFTPQHRTLRLLQGHALFEVRHEGRPFAVQAADVTVTATGTRFSVEVAEDRVSASLARGAVVVTRRNDLQRVVLAPGQTLLVVRGRPMRLSQASGLAADPAAPRFIEFRDTPLAQAVGLLNRHSAQQIRVTGSAGRLKITGRFRAGDPAGFVAAVSQLLPVKFRSASDGVLEIVAR